jgi:hypothetical protein
MNSTAYSLLAFGCAVGVPARLQAAGVLQRQLHLAVAQVLHGVDLPEAVQPRALGDHHREAHQVGQHADVVVRHRIGHGLQVGLLDQHGVDRARLERAHEAQHVAVGIHRVGLARQQHGLDQRAVFRPHATQELQRPEDLGGDVFALGELLVVLGAGRGLEVGVGGHRHQLRHPPVGRVNSSAVGSVNTVCTRPPSASGRLMGSVVTVTVPTGALVSRTV